MNAANPAPWNSVLGKDIGRYVLHKRALGRKYITEAATPRLLDRFLCERHIEELSRVDTVLVEAFLGSRQREPARSHNHLPGVIRCFFDWLWSSRSASSTPPCGYAPVVPAHAPHRFCSTAPWRGVCSMPPGHFRTGPPPRTEGEPTISSSP